MHIYLDFLKYPSFFVIFFLLLPKNYAFSDLYNQRILFDYNEADVCGVVFFHSTNTYQHLVYMSNLAEDDESTVCVCFPKNSEVYL